MTEKKRRAPGGGRKPMPEAARLIPVTVRLSPEMIEFCKTYGKEEGGMSALVRRLLRIEEWRVRKEL